jgi:glycosyltransferase involved in cell wall biosynthesis
VYECVGDDGFDIVHAHTDVWTMPFARFTSVPTLTTLHGRLDIDVARTVLALYPDMPLVSISNEQRRAVADLPLRWMATCPNGLDLSAYLDRPATPHGDYLAFVGRITPEKRPDWAVEVARRAGRTLRVAAKIDPVDIDYWETEIRPLFCASDVDFIGEIGEAEKPSFFGGAAATLFPVDWPEPFGLVMIESLASGTPVIALRKGAVPEVLSHDASGFVCDSLDEMVAAVDHVDRISPEACRREARRFTASAMTDMYLDVYDELVGERRSPMMLLPSASTGS